MKQKVFFFAAPAHADESLDGEEDLRRMALKYVDLYGEGCLKDPDTPTFVRRLLGKKIERELPRAG
mgnify:FL=1